MIAGKQNIRNPPTAEFNRASVMRIFEQPGGVRIIRSAVRITQNAWNQPGYSIDHDQRGQLAAGQDIIANRQLIGYQMGTDALIHPFITPAQERQARVTGQFTGNPLIKNPPLGSK